MIHHRTKHHVRFVHLIGILPILLLAVSSSIQVYARSVSEIQAEIQAKEEAKKEATIHSHGLGEEATGIQGEINALAQQIASIQSQIDINTSRQDDLTSQIEAAQKRVEEQKSLLSANIRSMYIEGDISPLEMIASSKNLGDFVDKQEYRDRIKDNISDTMDEIERLKKQLDSQKKEVTKILNDQKSLRGTLSVKNQEAGAKLASVNQDKAGFDAKVSAESKGIAKLQKEQQQIEAELARLSREASQPNQPNQGSVSSGQFIGTVGSTGNSTGAHLHLRAQYGNGVAINPMQFLGNRWSYPVQGPITQYFGSNPYQYGYGAAGHDGVDFGVRAGTPIYAVEPGVLVRKGWFGAFGCMAMLQHSDGLFSIYAHMQSSNC